MSDEIGASTDVVRQICRNHAQSRGPLMPILHELTERFGFVPPNTIPVVAEELNLTRAEVYGVFSFYDDFKSEPPAPHTVKVCRAEACQANGGRAVWDAAEATAAQSSGVEVEDVYCLGNCACSPAVQVDHRTIGRVDSAKVTQIIRDLDGRVTQ